MLTHDEQQQLNTLRLQFVGAINKVIGHSGDPLTTFYQIQIEGLKKQIKELEEKDKQP